MNRLVCMGIIAWNLFGSGKEDLGVGNWRFEAKESTYESGPAPKESRRQWVKVGDDHVRFIHDGVNADGKPFHTEFLAAYDEKPVEFVGGTLYDSVALKLVNSHKVEQVFRLKGQVTVRAVREISADGKKMTIDSRGVNKEGKKFVNLLVYLRD